jgi:hypothetical protein
MLTIDVSLNVLTLLLIVLASGLIGFGLKGRQIRKKQFKIVELRKEMVNNHAQILELEREFVVLESKLRETQTRVLPIKMPAKSAVQGEQREAQSAI